MAPWSAPMMDMTPAQWALTTNLMEKIIPRLPHQVFVFGSNRAGRHRLGAARDAVQFGARYGQGEGLMGQTYGIPTKDENIQTLPLSEIQIHVRRFIDFANQHPELEFLVSPIGTGLAGYTHLQIAPLFREALGKSNIKLPEPFLAVLKI